MAINRMSDLPLDLLEEVLSKVPLTSMRAVRLTCKKWNNIFKNRSFTEKRIAQAKKNQLEDLEVIMINNFRVYLMSVNLHNNADPSIRPKGKLITLNDDANPQEVDISCVFHCDGLLLCICKDLNFRLMVWNPNFGQTRWIKPRSSYHRLDNYALGYDKEENKKILRFVDHYSISAGELFSEFEVYSFKSNSWKVVRDVSPEWGELGQRGLSIKGNTYWYALKSPDSEEGDDGNDFLVCFDFTRERFGPHLPLPFHVFDPTEDAVTLSSVGQGQLAVLYQNSYTLRMEIWVTSKIEPEEVSWNKLFLAVYLRPRIGCRFWRGAASFIIDLKKNVVVVIDKDVYYSTTRARAIAYIIGKKGYFKTVDLGRSADESCYPLVFSYVPSSVQINQLT